MTPTHYAIAVLVALAIDIGCRLFVAACETFEALTEADRLGEEEKE